MRLVVFFLSFKSNGLTRRDKVTQLVKREEAIFEDITTRRATFLRLVVISPDSRTKP